MHTRTHAHIQNKNIASFVSQLSDYIVIPCNARLHVYVNATSIFANQQYTKRRNQLRHLFTLAAGQSAYAAFYGTYWVWRVHFHTALSDKLVSLSMC